MNKRCVRVTFKGDFVVDYAVPDDLSTPAFIKILRRDLIDIKSMLITMKRGE